jgi:Bromodomain
MYFCAIRLKSATPPPASASTSALSDVATPVPPSTTPTPTPALSTFSTAQFRFAQGVIRQLKKLKDAGPFLHPVDPVALNIPHYPNVIKSPMDFSTIDRKLSSSNPAKPDLTQQNPRYYNAEEFINDVRLIFSNCVTFNGPDHLVTAMGKRVEEVFDKQIKHMPAALEVST